MGKWWSFLFAAVMLLCGGLVVVAPFVGWWLPEGVSTHAGSVDKLYYFILIVTGFFFILTEALLCIFMYKYAANRAKSSEAQFRPGMVARLLNPVISRLDEHKVEMAWTVVPAVLLLVIAFTQVDVWATVKYQSRMPTLQENKTPLQAAVSVREFEWRVRYPSSERFQKWLKNEDTKGYASFAKAEHKDDVHVVNELHVIKENPAIVHLSTRDVIHSFNLPHLHIKQDALPGKIIPVWFTPTKSNTLLHKVFVKENLVNEELSFFEDGYAEDKDPGTDKRDDHYIWDLPCAELCGWGHYRMVGRLFVHRNEKDFLDWLKRAEALSNAQQRETTVAR